jgi:hypothetical protein
MIAHLRGMVALAISDAYSRRLLLAPRRGGSAGFLIGIHLDSYEG